MHPRRLCLALVVVALAGCASQPAYRGGGYSSMPGDRAGDYNAMSSVLYDQYEQWRGVPYRYGGVDRDGIDCSAFVQRTMTRLESLDMPRTTTAQARMGRRIAAGNMSPGDLVFFKTGHRSRHVGVYVGNGRFMHASTSQGVTLSRLDNPYWRRHYWQSRRVASHY